mmetsp:Transcript_14988/g.42538  ORF Transcript_14988/g.42538 Transcript_14988/m.42538 type:complete len:202 (-) Transcript_14988:812-1417(-)
MPYNQEKTAGAFTMYVALSRSGKFGSVTSSIALNNGTPQAWCVPKSLMSMMSGAEVSKVFCARQRLLISSNRASFFRQQYSIHFFLPTSLSIPGKSALPSRMSCTGLPFKSEPSNNPSGHHLSIKASSGVFPAANNSPNPYSSRHCPWSLSIFSALFTFPSLALTNRTRFASSNKWSLCNEGSSLHLTRKASTFARSDASR